MEFGCEPEVGLGLGLRPFVSISREGRGSSGSRPRTRCLLFGLESPASEQPFDRLISSLSRLRDVLGSNRRAEVGGTESRIFGCFDAWTTLIVDRFTNRLPRSSP